MVHFRDEVLGHFRSVDGVTLRVEGRSCEFRRQRRSARKCRGAATIDHERELRHRQWLQAALEMSRVLLGDVDHVQALRVVTGQIRKASSADYAAIVTVDPASPNATAMIEAIDGLDMERAADTVIPLKGLTAKVVKSGRPVINRNITHEEDFDPPGVVADALSLLGLGMYLPLAVAGTVLGVLVVGWRRGSPHEPSALEEAESIEMFPNQAALALQQVYARLLVAQDRARIADELRDDVIDQLFAIGTELHATPSPVAVTRHARLCLLSARWLGKHETATTAFSVVEVEPLDVLGGG
jgi:signal transduction histidine kinase